MSNMAGSEIQVVGMSTAQETALAALRAGSSFPQAAEMLKHLGVLRPRRAGSTDEQVLKLQIDLKEKRALRRAEVAMANHVLKKAQIPRGERRRALEGRATPQFMEDLRAVIEESERKKAPATTDATPGPNPGDAPHEGASEQTPADDSKTRPEREMGQSAGPAGEGPGDATGRATNDPLSHELVA